MELQKKLDQLKKRIEGNLPVEAVSIMHQATKELENTGIGDEILKVGDKAPQFILKNQNGEEIDSEDFLGKKAIVLTFYRGIWCPYCNTDLVSLNSYFEEITDLDGMLLSVSPQLPKFNQQTVERQKLKYDLLSDTNNDVASGFGLRWEMEEPLKSVYKNQFKIDLKDYNGDDTWSLPVPARFLIDKEGVIRYAEYAVDYTKRPEPDALIKVLKEI